jgi:hypothetical protein
MIPTTYAAGQKFIVLKTTDSRTYCYIPDADIVLAAGNQYNYTISVKDLKEVSTLTISDITPYTYDGTAKEPHPTVTDGSKTLTEGTDYTLSWSNNTNAGTATVTVTGMGGYYSGTQNKNFTINPIALTSSDLYFASSAITRAYIWEIGSGTNELTKPADCTVTYTSSVSGVATVNATTGVLTPGGTLNTNTTITATATGNYSGTATYTIKATSNYKTFSYINNTIQDITLPAGTYQLEVWGAGGGACVTKDTGSYLIIGIFDTSTYKNYMKGGYSIGTIVLTGETILYACVGGEGGNGMYLRTTPNPELSGGAGGYNGGGKGGDSSCESMSGGGGGGAGVHQAGGAGGGSTGGASVQITTTSVPINPATTSSNYYQLGQGGAGFDKTISNSYGTSGTGGGGGGYYGGKSYKGHGEYTDVGGAGGTGYIGGVTNGSTSSNQRSGNGQAKITWVGN